MHYLNAQMAKNAILKMKDFHKSLEDIHSKHNLDFFKDLGRRNILMSRPQEVFFCDEIQNSFSRASSDGRTGQPDILIPELEKELECKITTKRKGGSWALQADYATLEKKGKCDFLYLCCDDKFERFAVFHFRDLTVEDFKPPAPGSRGKSRLLLRNCMDRCSPLVGDIVERNKLFVDKARLRLVNSESEYDRKKAEKSLNYWLNNPKSYTIKLAKV